MYPMTLPSCAGCRSNCHSASTKVAAFDLVRSAPALPYMPRGLCSVCIEQGDANLHSDSAAMQHAASDVRVDRVALPSSCMGAQDGTLVHLKSSQDPQRGPLDAEDYKFYNDTVIQKVKELHDEGYKLVIFRRAPA